MILLTIIARSWFGPEMDTQAPLKFTDITVTTPTRESLARDYAAINALFDDGDIVEAAAMFDRVWSEITTWSALVHLAFNQNTADPAAKEALDYRDQFMPTVATAATAFQRRMLAHEDRAAIIHVVGAHAVALWEVDISTFRPELEADLVAESKLNAEYTALNAGAELQIQGQSVNLEGLAPFAQNLDRVIRHEAAFQQWSHFEAHAARYDEIFDQLVHRRHGMAVKLGYEDFTELAYRHLRRLDYRPDDVARYRVAIASHVTPLVTDILERRRKAFGWDRLMAWDEPLVDPLGNPAPVNGDGALLAGLQTMYDRMNPQIATFYRLLSENGFLDLDLRANKAGGGFCTEFPTHGMPFVFGSFSGTYDDIDLMTHEMGHAFQYYASRDLPNYDYRWPTAETAEIHSMSFELLSYPYAGLLVGDEAADRYRTLHMTQAMYRLPMMACFDHFQHEVYAKPNATPAERHEIWRALEKVYMPWRNWGDLAHPAKGGAWQRQLHVYQIPFYMIDYALAQCCALQFWTRSRKNYGVALEDYIALCRRGGSAPFLELVKSAGLISPFEPGALETSVAEVRDMLGPGIS